MELAALLAFVVSVPFMLPVRSMIITTSTGVSGESPHGPLHAAEVTTPVSPWSTPTARANEYGVVVLPATSMTLHLSPTEGSHAL